MERDTALQNRQPLQPGAVLRLEGSRFTIVDLLGAGGSSLVYNAVKYSSNGSVAGSLKEFYPMALGGTSYNYAQFQQSQQAIRREDGTLLLPDDICAEQTARLGQVIRLLRTLKEEGGLRFVIPHMELYTNAAGVPYLFTPENFAGVTLETYCEEARKDPKPEHLTQILHTLYAAACADSQLCRSGVLLLDIKPANLLLPYNSAKTAFLQDAVSLFDVESVVLTAQLDSRNKNIILPFSAGFTAPELGGYADSPRIHAVGPASDVFALGATLYTSLTGRTVQLASAVGHAAALQAGPFGACLPAPLADALGELLAHALTFEPAERMRNPEEFYRELARVLRLQEELTTARQARRWDDLRSRLPDVLTDLLFRWPVFTYSVPKNSSDAELEKDVRVLVAGDDDQAIRQALRALFSTCHVLHHQLHVRVIARNAETLAHSFYEGIDGAEQWILYRSRAGETAAYDWAASYIGELSWLNVYPDKETLPVLAEDFRAGTVLILASSETENAVLAGSVPEPAAGRRLCAYMSTESGRPLFADSRAALERVPLTPVPADDLIGQQAENIALNAHLVYTRSKNRSASMHQVHTEFKDWYNHTASLDTALAIRARLWSVGLPWHNDAERDGAAFAEAVAQDLGLIAELSWLEHRRWAASKLCGGARTMPESLYSKLLDGGANGSGTNKKLTDESGKKVLYHAYLVPSTLDEKRPVGWQTPRDWQQHTGDEPTPEALDPLSRAGAELSRMFARRAREIAPELHSGTFMPYQMMRYMLNRAARTLPDAEAAQLNDAREQLEKSIQALTADNARPAAAAIYRLAYDRLHQLLEKTGEEASLKELETLNGELFCFAYSCDAAEVKDLDTVLIENIAFQLRAHPLTAAKLMSTDLQDNLLVCKSFLVERLLCVAYCPSDRAAEKYARDAENLAAALEMGGADCQVELRLLLADGAAAPKNVTVPLQTVPVCGNMAAALAEALQGAEMVDLTGGQQQLCAYAGGFKDADACPLVLRQGTGSYGAVRGTLPAMLPCALRQPCRVKELFRLSGAVALNTEGDAARADYTRLYALYNEILEQYGKAAFYEACETFTEAYTKTSRLFVVPPTGPLDERVEYRLDAADSRALLPLLRELDTNGFIAGLTETPEPGVLTCVRFFAAESNGPYLHKLIQGQLNNSRPVLGYTRNDWGDLRYVVRLDPGTVGVADKPGCRNVLEYLQTKGCLQLRYTAGPFPLQVSGMAAFVPIMLEKYGTSLEKELYVRLRREDQTFEDVQTNFEYSYGADTRNELDVVLTCRDRPVVVSCKACRELAMSFVDEILARARLLNCGALPVLVCSELMPGQNPVFRARCESAGVLLIDGVSLASAADLISREVEMQEGAF